MKTVRSPRSARGVTLIEMLIAMTIGLVVVGAVMVSYLGSGQAGRIQAAYSQMNQDAQIGLSILNREFQMAGYSAPSGLVQDPPTAPPSTPTFSLTYNMGTATAVVGCGSGFVNPQGAGLACNPNPGALDTTPTFEVVYEADTRNTVPTGGGVPTDCVGAGIPAGPPFFARNRYFISAAGELSCASDNTAAQPLLENVVAMRVWYGVQVAAAPRQVAGYVTASQLIAQGAAASWNDVISVRVCLLMRSSEPVLTGEDTLAYRDCDGVLQAPLAADPFRLHLRRAYYSTSTLRSKMGL